MKCLKNYFLNLISRVTMTKKPMLQDWVLELDNHLQSALVSALRGNDNEDMISKDITRMLRYLVVRRDLPEGSTYMSSNVVHQSKVVKHLMETVLTNEHWVSHITHAVWVISKFHDNEYTRAYWGTVLGAYRSKIRTRDKNVKTMEKAVDLKRFKLIAPKYEEIYSNGYM